MRADPVNDDPLRRLAERNHSLLVALTQNLERSAFEVNICNVQGHQLTNAQTRGVEQLGDDSIPSLYGHRLGVLDLVLAPLCRLRFGLWLRKKTVNLAGLKHVRQAALFFWSCQ